MAKKITLKTLAAQIEKGFASADKKFEALADDISRLATKEDIATLGTQVNSIERQLREMNHIKLQDRVANLEEEVFGESRA